MVKRIVWLIAFSLLLFSCSGIFQGGPSNRSADGGTYLRVSAAAVKRTIAPSQEDVELSLLTNLVLKGSLASGGSEVTLAIADSISEFTDSDNPIPIKAGTWSLTLSAKLKGVTFSGSVTKVIEAGKNNDVSFELTVAEGFGGGLAIEVLFSSDSNSVTAAKATLAPWKEESDFAPVEESFEGISMEKDADGFTGSLLFARDILDEASRIPEGTYELTLDFFVDGSFRVDSISYLVRIADGVTTSASQTVKLNELFPVTYVDGGGNLAAGEVQALQYSLKSDAIRLPKMEKSGYAFLGWYEDSAFTRPVSEIAGGSSGEKTFYAAYSNTATVSAQGYPDANLAAGEAFDSIEAALAAIASYQAPIDWNVLIDGRLTGTSEIASGFTGAAASSLTISGANENSLPADLDIQELAPAEYYTDILDGNSVYAEVADESVIKGAVLSIKTAVPVIIKNLLITNGSPLSGAGGGIQVLEDASVTLESGAWLAENHTFGDGGAVGVAADASLFIKDGAIISLNTASEQGGAIASSGSVTMEGGVIAANYAGSDGSAVLHRGKLFSISGSASFSPSLDEAPGLIYLEDCCLTVSGELTGQSSVATLALANYADGAAVLLAGDGFTLSEDCIGKFDLVQPADGSAVFEITAEGLLSQKTADSSGSSGFDSGNLTITAGDLSSLSQNSRITLGAVDSSGKPLAGLASLAFDAKILYKGQDLVDLAPEGGRFYATSGNVITLCGDENHIPAGSYQLYVALTHPETGIASSQTFTMTITDSFATPETQYALYQRPEDSNFTSFYLTDEEEVENASLSSETFESNNSVTAFDVSGNFYAFAGTTVVSSNPVANNGDFSEYLSSYNDNWGLAIDLANNNFYVYGINEQTIELFRCSSFISSGSTTADDRQYTVSPSGFYAQKVAIYDDALYALGSYNDGAASTYQLWVYDISNGLTTDSSTKYTISLDAKLPDALSYAKYGSGNRYGDMIVLEGKLYLTVKALSSWTNENREIRNGALLRWVPGESDISVLGLAGKVTGREDIPQLYFYETSSDKSPVYADANGQSLLAIIGSKYSQDNDGGSLCNTYFPDVYAITSAADETAFANPARFVALKPKKLVIADDGYAFYTDSAGELLYKAANRLVTVDLEEFVIESVKSTNAYFEADMTGLLRSGITMDTIRAGGTYYDYNAAAWCLGSDTNYYEYSLSDSSNTGSIYLSVKEGQ